MIRTLPDIIDFHARKSPDREAFRFQSKGLTYRELSLFSDRLSQTLKELSVQKGDHVGIFSPKSLEVSVAIFGIMKSGAAYVPLDPKTPAARLETILRDAGIHVLVTVPELLPVLQPILDSGTV